MMDPQAKRFLAAAAAMDPPPTPWEQMPPPQAREAFASLDSLFGERVDVRHVNNLVWDGIPVRVYDDRPDGSDSSPTAAVMYFHGGGWVLGDLETHDAMCRMLAKHSGLPVAAVDYPLSPEHRHPAAILACYEATQHLAKNANSYGVDPQRLIVAGDSAGGHLAALVAIHARDAGLAGRLILQVLLYPVISPDFETPSYREFATDHGLSRAEMMYFWECYRPDGDDGAGQGGDVPISPADVNSHAGLPPAWIVTAGYDVLRDEAVQYAQTLRDAGVPVEHEAHDGMIHAFAHLSGVMDAGGEFLESLGQRLRAVGGA